MPDILSVKNVSKTYGSQRALNNISFTMPEGCITGLLGPNGSGKTTLIKIIMGLISDFTGDVDILANKPGPASCGSVSYLPDRTYLPEWITGAAAVGLFADFYCDFDKKTAVDMAESMNIPLNKRIKTLSRGMQEKLQLTLVMSRRAKLYVLDEPIAAVDPAARDFIMRTILSNCAEGSAILLSSHIISDIEPALDRAIFLKEGEIFINDEAENLRNENQTSLDGLFREVFKC